MQVYSKLLQISILMLFQIITINFAMADTVRATEVIEFKPKLPIGNVRMGHCWVNSIAVNRIDAWRCMIGNEIYDPCFATAVPDKLVCDFDPIDPTKTFTLQLTKPLPKPETYNAKLNPWLLQLGDGSICRPYTGTLPFTDKAIISYYCTAKSAKPNVADACEMGLLQGSIKSARVWTVTKVVYCKAPTSKFGLEIKQTQVTPIAKLWE